MPISEDELDGRVSSASASQSSHHRYSSPYGTGNSCLSKAEQRKNNKPIMEKRRRARINQCLNELKTLILDATNKDPARHTKLEKADILEMTVKHLQSIQRQQLSLAAASDHTVLHKFKTGFSECALEVGQYIDRLEGVESGVKQRLINHLTNYMVSLDPLLSFSSVFPPINPDGGIQSLRARLASSEDVNNNNNNHNNGDSADDRLNTGPSALHLIPSRLPTGELALLLPNSSSLNSLFSGATSASGAGAGLIIDRSHPSAFTAVSKDSGGSCKRPGTPEVSSTSNEPTSFPSFKPIDKAPVNGKTDLSCPLQRPHETSDPMMKQITVYADPPCALRRISSPTENNGNRSNVAGSNGSSGGPDKSPLDFSLKATAPLASTSSSSSASVRKKRPLEDLPCNDNLERPSKKLAKRDQSDTDEDRYSSDKQHAATIEKNENMWRPW